MLRLILGVILSLYFVAICEAQISNNIKDAKDFNETLDVLLVEGDLKPENSYRCGVFFAGDNINDDPRFKIFIIPKRFGTDCGRNKAAIQAEVKKECTDLFKVILTKVDMTSPSRKNPGSTIGNDLCKTLKEDAKMKRLPGPNHPKFPDGVPVGFYYNICTDTTWYDTELRVPTGVCCKDRKKWTNYPCP